MRTICLTVDLDRDANIPSAHSVRACSADRGSGTEPRFVSSRKGAESLAEMFDEIGLDATFFAEARTLRETNAAGLVSGYEVAVHGLDHEDLTGEHGTKMSECEVRDVLEQAKDMIRDLTGKDPKGFRAPYMKYADPMYGILEDLGFVYDSSKYSEMRSSFEPYRIGNIIEFPVPKGIDRNGKRIMAYLWPMHEGTRTPQDYIELAREMDDGVFVLATHTWHMAETMANGTMGAAEAETNKDNVRKIIETLLDDGFAFSAMGSLV